MNESTRLLPGPVTKDLLQVSDDVRPRQSAAAKLRQAALNSEFLSTDDWFACHVGFVGFFVVSFVAIFSPYSLPSLEPWSSRPWTAFNGPNAIGLLILLIFMELTLFPAFHFTKKTFHVGGFGLVFAVAVVAKLLGSQEALKSAGFGDSVWAMILGAVVVNALQLFKRALPPFLVAVVQAELYIKIGVVLMAVELESIVELGLPGVIVAWVDTPIVLLLMFAFGWRVLGLSTSESLVMSVATSVCGSSAAAAAATTIVAPPQLARTVIAVLSLFTVPQIPLLSFIARRTHMTSEIGGAWIGGSIDSTGAVIATAATAGPSFVTTAAIVKMIQNIAIGPICVVLTLIWHRTAKLDVLWNRFPKFVLGFVVVSVVVSSAFRHAEREMVIAQSFALSEAFSLMGFVCIGLEMGVDKMLSAMRGGGWKLLVLYCVGQTVDVLTTYGWSYLATTFL